MLFSSYILVMSISMLVSGALGTRLGGKRTMQVGLALVALFSAACGLSNSVTSLALLRGGWGFGNALFTSTALAIIVGLSTDGTAAAITLYEAALGLGIAGGPLVGGFLGTGSWRYPFFGTATLMAIAFIATTVLVSDPEMEERQSTVGDVLGALRDQRVLTNALAGLAYSFGFFTILAYSPLTLGSLTSIQLGLVFFCWGALVAISSVFLANRLVDRFGTVQTLAADLVGMIVILGAAGLFGGNSTTILVACVILSGLICGVANALFTTLAIEVSPYTRSVSSASYNALRWAGAAIAPVLEGYVGDHYGPMIPFYVGAVVVLLGLGLLALRGGVIRDALSSGSPTHG